MPYVLSIADCFYWDYIILSGGMQGDGDVWLSGFRKASRKVSDKWALPLNKRVRVSACKRHMPDTHVFVPTLHKLFLLIYWKLKRYEHLTLTTNQLVESSFLCFQDNSFYLLKGKELHRNRRPICTESFAGKMVGARVKCSLSVPLDSSNSGEKLCDS